MPASTVTVSELVDRHLALLHAAETTRRSYRQAAGKHVHPLFGPLRITTITPEILDRFYAELLRCRDHCRHPAPEHVCQPLYRATVRKIHYLLSGAFRRAVRWGWLDPTRQVLAIRASIAQVGAEVWEKDTKLHQRRHISLDSDTMALLLAYRQVRQGRAATVGTTLTPDAFLFSPAADGSTCHKPASFTSRYPEERAKIIYEELLNRPGKDEEPRSA